MLQKRRTLELNTLYFRRHRERKRILLADKMSELVEHGYNVILSLCLIFKQPYYIVLEIIIRQSMFFV
jgi:hypothetical protein